MPKVIIVEDEESTRNEVRKIIRKTLFKCDTEVDVCIYAKYCEELSNIIKDDSEKKIFILDIELNKSISGIKIAQLIRKNDWESEIIFMTNHDKMFEQVYRSLYKVFDFIEKYHDFEKRLTKDLKLILDKKHDNTMFKYSNRKISIQIYYKDITYITRDKKERKLVIYTTHNDFIINMTIGEMIKKLDKRFVIVHRSCVVNTDRVIEYNWAKGYFVLDTKEKVPMLSKKYKVGVEKI